MLAIPAIAWLYLFQMHDESTFYVEHKLNFPLHTHEQALLQIYEQCNKINLYHSPPWFGANRQRTSFLVWEISYLGCLFQHWCHVFLDSESKV